VSRLVPHEALSHQAIRALAAIILTAVTGIIVLSAWGLALRAGLAGDIGADIINAGSADEALSILGNIAAAAVGGLVGWLTRDLMVQTTVARQVVPVDEASEPLDTPQTPQEPRRGPDGVPE